MRDFVHSHPKNPSFNRLLPLLVALSGACTLDDSAVANEDDDEEDRGYAFVADPGPIVPGPSDDSSTTENAGVVASLTLENGARVVFVEEGESPDVPVIGIAVVEPANARSALAVAEQLGATPLELFIALAPAGTEPPPSLLRDHALRHAELGLGETPRDLQAIALAWPSQDDDPWSPECDREDGLDGWNAGFDAWSATAAGRSNAGLQTPDNADWYGYYGVNKQIWGGICISIYGITTTIMIEQWNTSSYKKVSGTNLNVPVGNRYRYYTSSGDGINPRRIKVSAADCNLCGENFFFASGAWRAELPI